MKNEVTVINVLNIYEQEISKHIKNKNRIYNFENNKMQNVSNIVNMLHNSCVGHRNYNIFLIYEPKCRLVMSLPVKDKIINHFVTRYSLEKNLTKYLDPRNCATRLGMGNSYAVKMVKSYIEKNKKYQNFYVLKIDIKKYFYSIDHKVLKQMLKEKLDNYEYEIISKIIDSTNNPEVNENIRRLVDNRDLDIPYYEYDKGLPIGNMTSQFLSIFYLHELDHFIVHDLHLKYYVRYMDDFIIMSSQKEKLKEALILIRQMLEDKYKLKISDKKTKIVSIKNGFDFLGYTFKVINHKTIVKIKRSNIKKIKRNIKQLNRDLQNNRVSLNRAFCSVMTYENCYQFGDNIRIKNLIDRYFYHEK